VALFFDTATIVECNRTDGPANINLGGNSFSHFLNQLLLFDSAHGTHTRYNISTSTTHIIDILMKA
jgi:hypothetical protein